MNRMNCHQFEERLNELLDRRRTPDEDEQLVSHATTCQSCRGALSMQMNVLDLIRQEVPEKLGHAKTKNNVGSRQSSASWLIAMATAVCFAIAVPRTGNQSTVEQPLQLADAQPLPVAPQVVEQEREGSDDNRTIFVAVDGAVESFNQFLASSTENTEWLEPVATPIRPLADSMTSTFNVLRQAMPRVKRIPQAQPTGELDSAGRRYAIANWA